ncbi:MAG: hypothetical protein IJD10_02980 [Clostridia bacterium]|nr:hypothetical protein [Clostridia bacterium]
MKSAIEELWYGNLCPNIPCHHATQEQKELMRFIADHHNSLRDTLTEKQKAILEKFDDCLGELINTNEREIFTYAFCLGARISIEVMSLSVE